MRHRTPHPKENNENGGHHDEILDALAELTQRAEEKPAQIIVYHRIPRARPQPPDWTQPVVFVYVPPDKEMPCEEESAAPARRAGRRSRRN